MNKLDKSQVFCHSLTRAAKQENDQLYWIGIIIDDNNYYSSISLKICKLVGSWT